MDFIVCGIKESQVLNFECFVSRVLTWFRIESCFLPINNWWMLKDLRWKFAFMADKELSNPAIGIQRKKEWMSKSSIMLLMIKTTFGKLRVTGGRGVDGISILSSWNFNEHRPSSMMLA
ncbi:hypothetical protein QQP08_011750 [Theobroma cacao]|nr:hypothetical protein QQP08_011750 [Theobroma cacao]